MRMPLADELRWLADKIPAFGDYAKDCANTMYRAADRIEALQAEVERIPAQRAQPTVKTDPVGIPNFAFFGVETDEEFADKGRAYTEVTG